MRSISAVVVVVDEIVIDMIVVDVEDIVTLVAPAARNALLPGILLFTLTATFILLPLGAAIVVAAVDVVMILDVTICSGACIGLYRMLVDWTSIPDCTPPATRLVFPTKTIRRVTTDCLT